MPSMSCPLILRASVHHAAIDTAVQPDSHVVSENLSQQRMDTLERLISDMTDQQATLKSCRFLPICCFCSTIATQKQNIPYKQHISLFLLPRRRPCGTRLQEKKGCSPLYCLSRLGAQPPELCEHL